MSFQSTTRHRFTVTFKLQDDSAKVLRLLAADQAEALQLAVRRLWGKSAAWFACPEGGGRVESARIGAVFMKQVDVADGY